MSTFLRKAPLAATVIALLIVIGFLSLIYGYRLGFWGLGAVFGGFSGYLWLPAIGAILGVGSALALFVQRNAFAGIAALAVGAAAAAITYLPIYMRGEASKVPPIHDITTDVSDPPAFVAILEERKDAPNPPEYDDGQTEQQLEAYPDIKPLVMPKPLPEAWDIAMDAVRAEGLKIKAAVPSEGRIEATETVPLFGFKDDVVIRLRDAHGRATVVDIRSKSRVGQSDLGYNARRIRSLLNFMRDKGGEIEAPTLKLDAEPEQQDI
ncbi:DUF1499 domain-containing protein [Parvularcula sp. ZS-1/3]|uniref:DUF1499 domain-containing protein n=1 Tax=Parvularcula mediterranea TaxID=2732508 RepID=A0A7Y3W591_9PROT|nr:DUF1499 domain-containing protein [Parvularcula mediterranea]NNU16550.1 DUF1499 domain-containing protein [Parvularcula mediterranea]